LISGDFANRCEQLGSEIPFGVARSQVPAVIFTIYHSPRLGQ